VRSTIGIDVDAPPRLVFDLARDIERWPDLLPHYVNVAAHPNGDGSVTARMVAVRSLVPAIGLGVPVAWRARAWAEEDVLRLRFRHLGGATAGMDVTWRIVAAGTGCRVSIEHDFRSSLPLWSVLVDRVFVRAIAGRTLATFRSIAEAVVRSDRAATTNTST
jgi:ribosome-associated toxin RatA of RatAB toxin-antitoxin module